MPSEQICEASDGVRIAHQHAGQGPPLVLLAGQANNHHWWDDVRADFEATHTTITLDYRGTGRSDSPREGYSTEIFARDVVAVLDDLGVDRADVYGTSMGGRVAQCLAAHHPDRVRGLALGCTSPGGRLGVERDAEVRRQLAQSDRTAARQALLELMYTPAGLATRRGPYRVLGDPTMAPNARRGHLRASDGHDGATLLGAIAAPTLVLHGTDDRLNPAANAPVLAERIPCARLRMVDGARHAYFDEYRSVAGPAVLDFLSTA
ncbi:alpha/beta hydrolase [Pseudonocardia nematodicida]|uniref:Alpha/beta hydrolase n=1 Tax=Pseudonocardia nematodicida TaxID=1206997 RepID=A0ABV1KJY6_9PSEU